MYISDFSTHIYCIVRACCARQVEAHWAELGTRPSLCYLFQLELGFVDYILICLRFGTYNSKHTLFLIVMSFNNFHDSNSFYLREVAGESLVHWHPWGKKAIQEAQKKDKPIFLSIGCSSSHWSRVLDLDSFKNDSVAEFLNKFFVCIKVDRDERPDVAKVYMAFMNMFDDMPFNAVLSPDLLPLFTAISFNHWESLLYTVGFREALWYKRKDNIKKQAVIAVDNFFNALPKTATSVKLKGRLGEKAVYLCAKELASEYNKKFGGLATDYMFPRPVEIHLMLYHSKMLWEAGAPDEANKVLKLVSFTLQWMAEHGIHDHIGGGFHRIGRRYRKFSTLIALDDEAEYSLVPHFEKVLYDQGQLASVYLDAFSITEDLFYSFISRDILDFLRRDMVGSDGGFFAALASDTADSEDIEKNEGAFYQWTTYEVEDILGPRLAEFFMQHYEIKPLGNGDDNEFKGRHVIEANCAAALEEYRLGMCRRKLYVARSHRPMPALDKTVIVSWNGLVISSFARASKILKGEMGTSFPVSGCDPEVYIVVAEKAASFIEEKLYNKNEGMLSHSYLHDCPSKLPGYLDDYAFLISGLLDLYEFGGGIKWLVWAIELQATQDALFLDRKGGGYYYSTQNDTTSYIRRVKDYRDGTEPSGNSVSAINLVRLDSMVGGKMGNYYRETAGHLLVVFKKWLKDEAWRMPLMCCAADMLEAERMLIVLIGDGPCAQFKKMLVAAHASYDPNRTVIHIDIGDEKCVEFWMRKNQLCASLLKVYRACNYGEVVAFVKKGSKKILHFTDLTKLEDLVSSRTKVVYRNKMTNTLLLQKDYADHCVFYVEVSAVRCIRRDLKRIKMETGAQVKITKEKKFIKSEGVCHCFRKIEIRSNIKDKEIYFDVVQAAKEMVLQHASHHLEL